MEKEEFLIKLTSSEEEEAAASSPRLHYFNKVHTLAAAALASPAAASQLCVVQPGAAVAGGRGPARAGHPVSFSGYNRGRERRQQPGERLSLHHVFPFR